MYVVTNEIKNQLNRIHILPQIKTVLKLLTKLNDTAKLKTH